MLRWCAATLLATLVVGALDYLLCSDSSSQESSRAPLHPLIFAEAKGVAGLGKAGGDSQGGSDKAGQQVPPEVYNALSYAGSIFLLILSVPFVCFGLNKLLNKIEDCFGCGPSSKREQEQLKRGLAGPNKSATGEPAKSTRRPDQRPNPVELERHQPSPLDASSLLRQNQQQYYAQQQQQQMHQKLKQAGASPHSLPYADPSYQLAALAPENSGNHETHLSQPSLAAPGAAMRLPFSRDTQH